MEHEDLQWYYNPASGEVTQGPESSWDQRMGPYGSKEEAMAALAKAQERTKAADDYDSEDDNWGTPASWEK